MVHPTVSHYIYIILHIIEEVFRDVINAALFLHALDVRHVCAPPTKL